MLVTSVSNRQNRNLALSTAVFIIIISALLCWFTIYALSLLILAPLVYWFIRQTTSRRLKVMKRPFSTDWQETLESRVAFYRALSDDEKQKFQQLVLIFLDEVRITGIGTDIDDTVRVLVAASAAIPIFGFDDFEYRRLGEVLIYPDRFGEDYQKSEEKDSNILGMVGLNNLRGVMILSKPSLLGGFANNSDGDNVGVHEFAHLVELEAGESGLPSEVPDDVAQKWVEYVARELEDPQNRSSVRPYAYTNRSEFFAVLSEYFFESPERLEKKDPELYTLLRKMFHQDTVSLFRRKRMKYDAKAKCPCKSGKIYKDCCLHAAA